MNARAALTLALLATATACGPAETGAPAAADTAASSGPVTADRIANAELEPGNWLTYSGQYHGQRFSRLDQVNRGNVDGLRLRWVHQVRSLTDVETTPVVVDGVMYLTESPNSRVVALDAATGGEFWSFEPRLADPILVCCGRQNRGVAVLGDHVYVGTLDARLIALDARAGTVVWDTKIADNATGHSITGAPLIVKDMVITGIAGGEYGIRGFLDAYDAESGEQRWRFWTIPGEGEPGNETWEGDSWRTGGAPTWVTGTYDPELDLIYWGIGNPGPDWNGDDREGDNLYSSGMVALNADDGTLAWHFQMTPHDVHDWDATQIPVLVDAEWEGQPRKLLTTANRNGFFYVLDRETGEFLLGEPFAKQTWAEGLDENGRPIRVPGMFPSEEGVEVYPSVDGAANWWSPTYSPRTGLFYQTSFDGSDIFFTGEWDYVPGQMFMGSAPQRPGPMDQFVSAIRAIDPATGAIVWEYDLQPKSASGLLSTAGDLVFGGSVDGYFFALDAETGQELWRINVGGGVDAAPMTYLANGEQYVTIAAGSSVFTFALDG